MKKHEIIDDISPSCRTINGGYRGYCPVCHREYALDIVFKDGVIESRCINGCPPERIRSEIFQEAGGEGRSKNETPHRGQPGGEHNDNTDHTSNLSNDNTNLSQEINIFIHCSGRWSRSGEVNHG